MPNSPDCNRGPFKTGAPGARRRVSPSDARILSRALSASFLVLACTVFPINLLRNGKWTSLFRLVSLGIVAFLFVLRKDAVSLSPRP